MLVGIAGLAWQDVTAEDAPTLHSLVGPNAVASLTVRTVRARTCVVDGWLTVGAGRRATDVQDLDADDQPDRYCRDVPEPIELADGDVAVPGWDELVLAQQEQTFDTRLGLLGDRVAEARSCTTAVGPGAVLALARSDGVATNYAPDPTDVDEALLTTCPVTVVDLGRFRRRASQATRRRKPRRKLAALPCPPSMPRWLNCWRTCPRTSRCSWPASPTALRPSRPKTRSRARSRPLRCASLSQPVPNRTASSTDPTG